jgi:hypothetical protein
VVAEAARGAGLTPSGYAAEAALAAANGVDAPSTAPLREALLELMAARGQVRRFGVNVNQAVRELNATGDVPPWLAQAVSLTLRAVSQLEQAASVVAVASRSHQPPRPPRAAGPPRAGHRADSPVTGAAQRQEEKA